MSKGLWFPHLHTHDDHSIKDGCAGVEAYADMVVEAGGDSLCISNHGQAAGFARQYFACRDRGIKPIYAIEAYINDARLSKIRETIQDLRKKAKGKTGGAAREKLARADALLKERFRPSRHVILIAQTREGYRNLVRISSDSWIRGYYYVPRTDTKFLCEHSEGVIYMTACMGGQIPWLVRNDFDEAVREARKLQKVFGDRFYVELLIHSYEPQAQTNALMLKLAREIKAPTVVTCDVHYARAQDSLAQDSLLLMRDKKTFKDREAGENVWQFESKDLFFRNAREVVECWRKYHAHYLPKDVLLESMRNARRISDSVEGWEFDTALKLPGIYSTPDRTLREKVAAGLRHRSTTGEVPASGKTRREYAERVRRELQVISAKNFSEYFLILQDITDHAREIGSRLGPGRGSAGGSLIAFLLRITDIDPLRFGLLFERFLDPDREDPPDIDLDFSPEHRDGIKDYIAKRYPATASIASYATFKPRGTLQDVGRVFGLDYRAMLNITTELGTDADKLTWDEIFQEWPKVKEWADENQKAFGVAKTLKGLISHRGKNAAGVLIAPADALDEIPMVTDPGDGSISTAFPDSQGDGVTYQGREITRLGYLKMDILGVRNLNIAPRAVEILERESGERIDLETLPLDDPDSLAVATMAQVPGVFQLDSPVASQILKTIKVDAFSDLVMTTALGRPGPLKNEIHKEFARLKQSGSAWKHEVHPDLADVLRESRGLMILQEDVMFVVQILGGLTFAEANKVRKVIGKKLDPEAFKPWLEKFIAGGIKKGHSEKFLRDTWDRIATFARYGFNKAHSVAYMLTAYRQLYMLTHYPDCYFAALLAETPRGKRAAGRGGEPMIDFMREAMRRGIRVRPPSVLTSGAEFDLVDGEISYGLGKIKGVGIGAEAVLDARPFETLEELHEKIDKKRANAAKVKALIYSGAMDCLPMEDEDFDPGGTEVERRNTIIARYDELRKAKAEPEELTPLVLLDREADAVGLPLSWWSGPSPGTLREAEGLDTIRDALEQDLRRFEVVAQITRVRKHKGKRGMMAFCGLADETGEIDNFIVWAEQLNLYRERIEPGRFVVARLERRANANARYGRWAYYLDSRYRGGPQLESAFRLLRRL